MLDRYLQPRLQPVLDRLAGLLLDRRITANQVTLTGFLAGIIGCVAIVMHAPIPALILWGMNRALDGLDGALARSTRVTLLGGYLDILLDMVIYGGIVMAHAIAYPADAIWACGLLFSFVGCGTSFLAWAAVFGNADNISSQPPIRKSFLYQRGMAEGTETLIALSLMIICPGWFRPIATIFCAMCWITVLQRISMAIIAQGQRTHSITDVFATPVEHPDD